MFKSAVLTLLILTLYSCSKKEESFYSNCDHQDSEATKITDLINGQTYSGKLYFEKTPNHELVITLENDGGEVLHNFILQKEDDFEVLVVPEGKNGIVHFLEQGIFIQYINHTYFVGGEASIPILENYSHLINDNHQDIIGYGFSSHKGEWTQQLSQENLRMQKNSVHSVFDYAFNMGVNDPSPGLGGGDIECFAGGPGAVSCSISKNGTSCTVTCGDGYYACCEYFCRCVEDK